MNGRKLVKQGVDFRQPLLSILKFKRLGCSRCRRRSSERRDPGLYDGAFAFNDIF